MKQVSKIDSNGLYVEPVIVEDNEELEVDLIDIPVPEGFYHPKWNGTAWVEAKTQAEIDALKNAPVPPTPLEELQKENADLKQQLANTNADLTAFIDHYFANGGM